MEQRAFAVVVEDSDQATYGVASVHLNLDRANEAADALAKKIAEQSGRKAFVPEENPGYDRPTWIVADPNVDPPGEDDFAIWIQVELTKLVS